MCGPEKRELICRRLENEICGQTYGNFRLVCACIWLGLAYSIYTTYCQRATNEANSNIRVKIVPSFS